MKKLNNTLKNPRLLELVRKKFCEVCMHPPLNDAHHLRTRGAGGDDSPENLMALCRKCHTEWHMIGIKSFVLKQNLQNIIDISEIYPKRKTPLFKDPEILNSNQ